MIVTHASSSDLDEIFLVLGAQNAFEPLDDAAILRLKSMSRLVELGDGENMYSQGARVLSAYVLVEGTVLLWRRCPDGVERPINALRESVWMTSHTTCTGLPRLTRMSASGPARLVVADGPAFEAWLEDDARPWRWIAMMTSRDVARLADLITALLVDGTDARVAARLAAMASATDGDDYSVEISQTQLAQLCGVSRNTVHRTLTRFERRGLVRRGYRRLEILDRPHLERVVTAASDG